MEEQRQDESPEDEAKPSDERVEDLEPEKDDSGEVKGGIQGNLGKGWAE